MFTSEPSLPQRVERMIRETPIVDLRSRVKSDRPNAPDLAALIEHPRVLAELRSVGLAESDSAPSLPPDERVRRALPHLEKTRNTAASWGLFRIFRELYDFHDPVLTESNVRPLFDAVAATARDAGWTSRVIGDRCGVEIAVSDSEHAGESGPIVRRLELGGLFAADPVRASDALKSWLGEIPATAARTESLIHDRLDASLAGGTKFVGTSVPIGGRPREGDDADVAVGAILSWHHERRRTFQLAVGPCDLDGPALPALFARFPNARFDLAAGGTGTDAGRLAELARTFPNVSILGFAACGFSPPAVERNAALLLQTVPATKWSPFATDAPNVEWTYGRLQIAKKGLARALASLVDAGAYEEDEIPAILRRVLHDAPISTYEL